MEEDLYKMQMARLAFKGFVRDKIQDDSPNPVYGFYTKTEAINGTLYEFTASLKESGEFNMHVSLARPDYDAASIHGIEAIVIDTTRAKVLRENLQSLGADITRALEKTMPKCEVSINMTPTTTVGLKGILVNDTKEPADEIYEQLKGYLENKGK